MVDSELKQLKVLKRQSAASSGHSESDFDELIVQQASSISSALNSAGVLRGRELRFIAAQVANIDLLFGEVDGDELVRLVIVEDKLFKNPESGRKVLAQILEYASKSISADEILRKATAEARDWLSSRRDSLEQLLTRGDFLLMICGDRINPRLIEIARPMLDRQTLVLRGVELVLVSLAHYEGDGMAVVVPNLVGAVTNFEREFRIEVTVRTEGGAELPAKVMLAEHAPTATRAPPARTQPWTEERFLERVRFNAKNWAEGDWAGSFAAILRWCEQTPGLVVRWAPAKNQNGYFTIAAVGPTGEVKVAWANVHYGVGVWSEALVGALGEKIARSHIDTLARRLNVSLEDDELGDLQTFPDFRDQKAREVLFEWLTAMRDEISRLPSL